jgi:hypothetical protein
VASKGFLRPNGGPVVVKVNGHDYVAGVAHPSVADATHIRAAISSSAHAGSGLPWQGLPSLRGGLIN